MSNRIMCLDVYYEDGTVEHLEVRNDSELVEVLRRDAVVIRKGDGVTP